MAGGLMRLAATIAIIGALGAAGCESQSGSQIYARLSYLEVQVKVLESQNAVLVGANKDLVTRLEAVEARLDGVANLASEKPTPVNEYIMWQSFQYRGEYLRSPPKPKPLFAYEAAAGCWDAVKENIAKFKGNPENHTYVQDAPGGVDYVTLTCLPKGVDPR